MPPYHSYEQLLQNNRAWADERRRTEPDYFERLAAGQKPPFLFIGCADSRKPLDTITQSEPGELFIHRNIANQVRLTDPSAMAILEFAIEALDVRHVIVCGHSGCGGVRAALLGDAPPRVEDWVAPVRAVYHANRDELERLEDLDARADRLSELNVVAQVQNVCGASSLHRAFARGCYPLLHGWMFDLRTGLINELALPLQAWKREGLVPRDYPL